MEHSFDIQVARKYGVPAAIIYRHMQFWISKNNADRRHYHDGRTWTYCSRKSLAELFDYLGEAQIRGAINILVKAGILRTGNYNRRGFDRTCWYAFEDEKTALLGCPAHWRKSPMEDAKTANPLAKIANRYQIRKQITAQIEREKQPGPEELAQGDYRAAKAHCGDLSPPFFKWFEKEVLLRFNKYRTNSAILCDWHKIWGGPARQRLTEALSRHRAASDNWAPQLGAISKLTAQIVQEQQQRRLAKRRAKEKQDQRQQEEYLRKNPAPEFYSSLTESQAVDRYRNGTDFDRTQLRKKRPEIVELCEVGVT